MLREADILGSTREECDDTVVQEVYFVQNLVWPGRILKKWTGQGG